MRARWPTPRPPPQLGGAGTARCVVSPHQRPDVPRASPPARLSTQYAFSQLAMGLVFGAVAISVLRNLRQGRELATRGAARGAAAATDPAQAARAKEKEAQLRKASAPAARSLHLPARPRPHACARHVAVRARAPPSPRLRR